MKTILFAWELGANLGHAAVLGRFASELAGESVRVVVAGRDSANTEVGFAGVPHLLLPAPAWGLRRHFGPEGGQANYLDVLVFAGFADRTRLSAGIAAWRGILDLVQPDVVVADHSPGLLLALRGYAVPTVAVGTGYTMPPLDWPTFPPLRADRAPIMPEARLSATIADVLAPYGVPAAESLPAWFRTPERIVFSYPELDPYRAFRREDVHRPPEPMEPYSEPPREPRLFVYLGDETPNLDAIIQTLVLMDIPIEAYLRGNVGPLPEFLEVRGHTVHRTPPSLPALLGGVSHVLTAGGSHTAHAALAAGRPQLVLPLHNETELNAGMLRKLGVARELPKTTEPEKIRAAVEAFVTDHALLGNARGWASIVAGREQAQGSDVTLATIRRLFGQGASPPS